jgi:hypothetical protein
MQRRTLNHLALAVLLLGPVHAALAQTRPQAKTQAALPKLDLTVELRQVEESGTAGFTASTQSPQPLLEQQQVQVRNGEKASLSMGQSIPMQWTQSVSSHSSSLAAGTATAASQGGAVTQALTWMDAGQSITVLPRWAGAKQPVSVEVEVQSASVGPRTGTELPTRSRSQWVSTVTLPLGQWVTIATSGKTPLTGVVSSEAAIESRRMLQIRVLAP